MATNTNINTSTSEAPRTIERVVLTPTMPLADAKQVPWQGSRHQGHMWELLQNKEIDANDLGWEMVHAYRPEAREAARTLLIYHLGTSEVVEATHRFGPHVHGESTYLEDKQYDNLLNAVIYLFLGFAIALYVSIWLTIGTIDQLSKGHPWQIVFAAAAILLSPFVILALFLSRYIRGKIEAFRNYRSGRVGETFVLEALRANLDNRWTIFRSLVIPDSGKRNNTGDTDLILVGPSGVRVLEIKAHKSKLGVVNGIWQYKAKNRWRALRQDPSKQAKRNASALKIYLEQYGIPIRWVEPIVVLTQPQLAQDFAGCPTDIWFHFDVANKIRALTASAGNSSDEEVSQRVVSLLKALASKK